MKDKRTRLCFKQKATGQIYFEATVEIINPYDESNPEDVAEISKTASEKLAEEAVSILDSATKKFTDGGYTVVTVKENKE